MGVALWPAGSLCFRLYLTYSDTYNAVYDSMGAAIILMLWLYQTGAAILMGGEINSEVERAAGAEEAKLPGEKRPYLGVRRKLMLTQLAPFGNPCKTVRWPCKRTLFNSECFRVY